MFSPGLGYSPHIVDRIASPKWRLATVAWPGPSSIHRNLQEDQAATISS
jgi:hypothetical protein